MESIAPAPWTDLIGIALLALALLLARALHARGRRLRELKGRLDCAEQARAHALEQLAQARRQIEQLQRDLVMSRRARPAAAAAPKPEAPAPAARSPLLLDDEVEIEDRGPPSQGFAQTMPFPL